MSVAEAKLSPDGEAGQRYFIPEKLTILYHAPIYSELSPGQRLRYNQLFGLFVTEFVLLCEMHFSQAYTSLLNGSLVSNQLKDDIAGFLDDEKRHTEMFRGLNFRAAPELYRASPFNFISFPYVLGAVARTMMRFPSVFPFFFALVYMQEEKLLYYGHCFAEGGDLLDPNFAAAHESHREDEVRHADLDMTVLTILWERASPAVRRMNVWLLKRIFREFFTVPKRAGNRILERLIIEFPELRPRRNELEKQLFTAGTTGEFAEHLYGDSCIPGCMRFFSAYPEFKEIVNDIQSFRNREANGALS